MFAESSTGKMYVCRVCQTRFLLKMGQCPVCRVWGSFQRLLTDNAHPLPQSPVGAAGVIPNHTLQSLSDVSTEDCQRLTCGIGEFDRVLGGGLVSGSVVLIGGQPGIGKSTLLLQACAAFAVDQTVLYVCGEESPQQIKQRAIRLGLAHAPVRLGTETCIEQILTQIHAVQPTILVVDSIQTVYTRTRKAAPGATSQIRESTLKLVSFAKQHHTRVLIVGHATKEGDLAGPLGLQHMVDTVLYFEGEPSDPQRTLRLLKNRFGDCQATGRFTMGEQGLEQFQ